MQVRSGLDSAGFENLKGCKIGLVTNQTGRDRNFRRTSVVLEMSNVEVAALFGPEHGYYGVEQDAIGLEGVERDRWSGVPVYSLYRPTNSEASENPYGPPTGSLAGLDALVFDIQDVGVRYYTYPTTLGILMEQSDLPLYVVDRPNPLGGTIVEGPFIDPGFSSFVGRYPQIPVRHGLTLGELALFINRFFLDGKAKLEVLKMEGWKREMSWEDTGLPWIPPSPNLPAILNTRLYPGTCLFEGTGLSIGRGTTQPFQLIGAPWIQKPEKIARELNNLNLPGLFFRDTFFKPAYDRFIGETCGGVQVHILPGIEKNGLDKIVRSGLEMVAGFYRFSLVEHQKWDWLEEHFDRLIGSDLPRKTILQTEGSSIGLESLFNNWTLQETSYSAQRQEVLLYNG